MRIKDALGARLRARVRNFASIIILFLRLVFHRLSDFKPIYTMQ